MTTDPPAGKKIYFLLSASLPVSLLTLLPAPLPASLLHFLLYIMLYFNFIEMWNGVTAITCSGVEVHLQEVMTCLLCLTVSAV